MKKLKLTRNLWVFAGVCFILTIFFNIIDDKPLYLPAINGFTGILCFINAYNNHKRIKEEDKQ